ncbi:MAG: hypothetical protein BGO11_18385 [Solirubrobacterales bacterium 70-9]|nr:MAG: hypothetical protein BGO11_18385 [Solirubrobacterales bacterium 70-9]
MAASRTVIDRSTRAEASRQRRGWNWDAEQRAAVFLIPSLAKRSLRAVGYRPGDQGTWIGPDGERLGDLDEAVRLEFTAAALAAAEPRSDPMEEALRQICEVADVPAGEALLGPEERIRALTAKLERIGNIAADREPDEDWRPAFIEEVGSVTPDTRRRIEGPFPLTRLQFAANVRRLWHERRPNLTLKGLAARSKIDEVELDELLHGERRVFIDVIYLLAGALVVEPAALFEGIEWTPTAEDGSRWRITGGGRHD